jgi:predicted nucleotidyltransferase
MGVVQWTSDPTADRLLRDLIERVSHAIASDSFSVYVMGSFATGDGSAESDVDAAVVWDGSPNTLELVGVSKAANNSRSLSGKRLDPLVTSVRELTQPWLADKLPGLLRKSQLLHGRDRLAEVDLPALNVHVEALRTRACSMMRNIRGGQQIRDHALLPDPDAPFVGYTRRRTWYPAGIPNGTRELVDLVAAVAAPLAAVAIGDYVTSKRSAIEMFTSSAADPWAGFVDDVYRRCAHQWRYRIPDDDDSRLQLAEFCLSANAFENHYLEGNPCG